MARIKVDDKFGKLTVISIKPGTETTRIKFLCKCDCGNETCKTDKFLKKRVHVTCGCHLLKNKKSKVCVICQIEKPKSDYHSNNIKACGVQSKCIQCMAEYKKKRYWSNHEIELAKYTKSRLKPKNLIQRKNYYKKNTQVFKERYIKFRNNPEKVAKQKEKAAEYRRLNADKLNAQQKIYHTQLGGKEKKRIYHKKRYTTDLNYNITKKLRYRLKNLVRLLKNDNLKSTKSAINFLGCDLEFFKTHLESKFTEGMTWELFVKAKIHLDHIKPCAKFDLRNIEEQKKCFFLEKLTASMGRG